MANDIKLSLAAATLALPFWGAFGFLLAGLATLTVVLFLRHGEQT